MARKSIQIGDMEFKFQKEALMFFKKILSSYKDDEIIKVSSCHHNMLSKLIERHPEADQKKGVGIKHFYKARTDKGTSCFYIEREDGSTTEFSYIFAVKAKGKSLYQEFLDACRHSVEDYLIKIKDLFFHTRSDSEGKVECELTGRKISRKESHLDHMAPLTFQVIVKTFICANKIKISKEMLTSPSDNRITPKFIDEEMKNKFVEFHEYITKDNLRIIESRSNLSLGGTEKIKKPKRPV